MPARCATWMTATAWQPRARRAACPPHHHPSVARRALSSSSSTSTGTPCPSGCAWMPAASTCLAPAAQPHPAGSSSTSSWAPAAQRPRCRQRWTCGCAAHPGSQLRRSSCRAGAGSRARSAPVHRHASACTARPLSGASPNGRPRLEACCSPLRPCCLLRVSSPGGENGSRAEVSGSGAVCDLPSPGV